jgi:predicted transposase YbfD/YdcC
MATTPVSLQQHFAHLIDPRSQRSRPHELLDLLGLALWAVICGAESWPAVAAYGRAKRAWLAQFFRLPNGLPSQETFRRGVCLLEPPAFQPSFAAGIAALAEGGLGSRRTIPLDGKTVRPSGRRGSGLASLHLVSAWAAANHVRLGQVAVDDKSQESTAIPRLREVLALSGALVTLDAMGSQKEIAAQIIPGGGDYLRAVTENQPHLPQDLDACFRVALETEFAGLEYRVARTEEIHRGRDEMRECHLIARPKGLRDAGLWKGLTAICRMLSHRVVECLESLELRYYIGSFAGTADE